MGVIGCCHVVLLFDGFTEPEPAITRPTRILREIFRVTFNEHEVGVIVRKKKILALFPLSTELLSNQREDSG